MRRSPFENQVCSAAEALSEIGEWWTLLILREAFFGTQRFTDFQARLGIARNILSARLNKLVETGILIPPSRAGPRQSPTLQIEREKGREMLPVFIALMQWGDRWINGDGKVPIRIVEAATGEEIEPIRVRSRDGRPLAAREMRIVPGPGADADIRQRFGPAALAGEQPETAFSLRRQ